MTPAQWDIIQRSARLESFPQTPTALIVDSPWIPGYLGISTLDYLTLPEVWLKANLQVEQAFPGIIFLPGFWVEMGMCAEPSAFGSRISFYTCKTPSAHAMWSAVEDIPDLSQPNPRTDGLMPVILNYYRHLEPRVKDAGQVIKIVAARGPLTVAAHLLGVSNFLLGLKTEPAATQRLLRTTTTLVKDWLDAQAEALSGVEGVLLLDDLAGFLSPKDYQAFAHPCLKEIFNAFPRAVKIFHNDTDNPVSFRFLKDLGIHILNFTHLQPLPKVRELAGPDICLLGNVPPLEVLVRGTPQQVAHAAAECLRAHPSRRGLILSAGGGTSPGTPGENVAALADAARQAEEQHA